MSIEKLLEKVKGYDYPKGKFDEEESDRLKFVEKFPLESIGKLTLDEYVQGTDKNSFAYWLEFKGVLFGIGGGNASKFGIYKGKDGNYHSKEYNILQGKELADLFEKIRIGIVTALDFTKNDRVSEIKNLDIPIWKIVLQKILAIYYPEKFLQIGASDVLINFAKDIELKNVELTPQNLIEINYEGRKLLDSKAEFKDWNYAQLSTYIWGNYKIEKSTEKDGNKHYWLYAPGANAEYWKEFYSEGIMGLGWDKLGDLNNYNSKWEILNKLQEIENTTALKRNDVSANFEFKNVVSIGDIIIVKKGRDELLGYGTVTSDYFYESTRSHYQKCRKVDWEKEGSWKTDHKLALKTLTDITKYPSEHPNYKNYYERLLGIMNNGPYQEENEQQENIPLPKPEVIITNKSALNSILFGPPGTGKTYNTINKALEIIGENIEGKTRQEIKALFNTKMKEGQIVFTTFHQSMSYEDFIEGIKPQEPIKEGSHLTYKVVDGIFKSLCKSASILTSSTFELSYNKFIEDIKEPEQGIELKAGNETILVSLHPNGNDLGIESNSYIRTITKEGLKYVSDSQRFAGVWGKYYRAIYKELEDKYGYQVDKKDFNKNYVLIIDEINRGNIAQIFGELITLIEEDKRLGKEEALEAMLPYSKEKFGVPSNLYIIGTMNTADRSVEALDAALRRRFSFEEITPKYDLEGLNYEYQGIKASSILKTINKRIEKLLDKDHQIGHSYFLINKNESSEEKILSAFYENIIPLLQEYFYGDYGKIGLVLGTGFVKKKEWNKNDDSFADFDAESASDFEDRDVFEIIDYTNTTTKYSIKQKKIDEYISMNFAKAIKMLMNREIEQD